MSKSRTAAIVLAAGQGTRMKSALPKVLHPVAGRPMIGHLLDRLEAFQPERTVIVVSPGTPEVADFVAPATTVIQDPPLGTGHAVMAARDALEGFDGDVLVLCGDTPLLTAATMQEMVAARRAKSDPAVVVLGFRPDDPGEYGRLVTGSGGGLDSIVEYKEADDSQRAIGLCNAGIMAIDGKRLFELVDAVGNDNAKGEFYLTDIIGIARSKGWDCAVVETDDCDEVMGVNSRAGLAEAEAAMQNRLRAAAMANGVTLTSPETVWFNSDTRLGRDVSIGPNVVFGAGVTIGDDVEIRAFCHIDGATVENGAVIGPYARLRPGADIGPDVHVGNFVEIKAARLDEGAKANHLSYIGDSWVGAGANIGAGTITCNYDGFFKSKTEIGEGAFIGSNTALVAPVKVGAGAITGAGSVIAKDVPDNALAITRSPQTDRAGWAMQYRLRKQAEKDGTAQKKSKKAS
ncbi:MAG: bifunctional UDP-N-acetylglucosamine diphosphorylase/glucosamine-1-phosphate N-acetyltransferase GlmU [Rhodospirillaceae bacterium]|jgi:bifunctional UDP-N-acetylglucosamine pyrophosphorylase / glucosamine-1-phosphate N-acetyltransferase|nr:bifunctional UDP-N-acetylglucosamine diphosphorylase/glucosamine-1-phosphate N-acetyltransferase GlmU [Rhodospirillaceae bacterium]